MFILFAAIIGKIISLIHLKISISLVNYYNEYHYIFGLANKLYDFEF